MRNTIPIVLTSGLPRSGSTLLQNLLAQSALHYCTATNDLIDILSNIRDKWMTCEGFQAQGLSNIEPRIITLMCGMVEGFYSKEFTAGKTVFDKSRGHLTNIELWEMVLGRKVKVIVTIRDVRDVCASFEKLHRKSTLTRHPAKSQEEAIFNTTVRGRSQLNLMVGSRVGFALHAIQDAFDRGLADRLVIVPYRDLTWNPVGTIRRVCEECGLPAFTCDPSRVMQTTHEDDTIYGMNLHTIRSRVEPDRGCGWEGVLPPDLADQIDQQYASIQELARTPRV